MAAAVSRSSPSCDGATSIPTRPGCSAPSSGPNRRPNPEEGGTTVAHENRRVCNGNTLGEPHIPVKNMMWAFGVPGYMIHGTPGAGFSVIPVDFSVAPGMYTT